MATKRRGKPAARTSVRDRKVKTSVWDCPVCCEQMVGGPRCYEHNPTPEMRELDPTRYTSSKYAGAADLQKDKGWDDDSGQQ